MHRGVVGMVIVYGGGQGCVRVLSSQSSPEVGDGEGWALLSSLG